MSADPTPMSSSMTDSTITVSFADGLRRLADLLDAHPEAGQPYDEYRHLIYLGTREDLLGVVRALGGYWEKDKNPTDYFGMTRDVGGGVTIYAYVPRSVVCERVVTGTRTVMRPATPTETATLEVPMVEVEEDVVEWRCAPSLLAAAGDRA